MLFATFGYLCFGNLGEFHIADYDEARHGINAYEMIQNNDYIVHTFLGEPDLWNTKPPLSFWLISLAYRMFGYNAFALRFFAALSVVIAAAAIGLLAMRYYGRWAMPLILLIFAANSILYGNHFTRFGDADSQYQLFFTLSMLCLLLSQKKFSWLYGCGLFFSLAFLEKSVHAFMIPVVCFFSLVFTGRLKELTWKRVLLLFASGLTLVLAWLIARIARDGLAFFANSLDQDIVSRIGDNAEPLFADQNVVFYNFLAVFGKPTTFSCLLLCVACAAVIWRKNIELSPFTRHAVIAALSWLLVPIILYTLANVKFRWYVYSGLLALPALTAILLFTVLNSGALKKTRIAVLSVFCALLIVMAAVNVVYVAGIRFDHTMQGFIREALDRDIDGGKHAYILYAEDGYDSWMPADILTAQFYGDLICKDGGLEGFRADEEPSLLIIARTNNEELIEELLGEEAEYYSNYYCVALEKY
jgi:4-amino-4-deoxy-L-arabinose transferase-like glycosyltransferase